MVLQMMQLVSKLSRAFCQQENGLKTTQLMYPQHDVHLSQRALEIEAALIQPRLEGFLKYDSKSEGFGNIGTYTGEITDLNDAHGEGQIHGSAKGDIYTGIFFENRIDGYCKCLEFV